MQDEYGPGVQAVVAEALTAGVGPAPGEEPVALAVHGSAGGKGGPVGSAGAGEEAGPAGEVSTGGPCGGDADPGPASHRAGGSGAGGHAPAPGEMVGQGPGPSRPHNLAHKTHPDVKVAARTQHQARKQVRPQRQLVGPVSGPVPVIAPDGGQSHPSLLGPPQPSLGARKRRLGSEEGMADAGPGAAAGKANKGAGVKEEEEQEGGAGGAAQGEEGVQRRGRKRAARTNTTTARPGGPAPPPGVGATGGPPTARKRGSAAAAANAVRLAAHARARRKGAGTTAAPAAVLQQRAGNHFGVAFPEGDQPQGLEMGVNMAGHLGAVATEQLGGSSQLPLIAGNQLYSIMRNLTAAAAAQLLGHAPPQPPAPPAQLLITFSPAPGFEPGAALPIPPEPVPYQLVAHSNNRFKMERVDQTQGPTYLEAQRLVCTGGCSQLASGPGEPVRLELQVCASNVYVAHPAFGASVPVC